MIVEAANGDGDQLQLRGDYFLNLFQAATIKLETFASTTLFENVSTQKLFTNQTDRSKGRLSPRVSTPGGTWCGRGPVWSW